MKNMRQTKLIIGAFAIASMIGFSSIAAQAMPVYFDAGPSTTVTVNDPFTVSLYLDSGATAPVTSQLFGYAFNATDNGLTTNGVTGNGSYLDLGSNPVYENNYLANIFVPGSMAVIDPNSPTDVFLAAFELVATAAGEFQLDVSGIASLFLEPLPLFFDAGLTIIAEAAPVPEPGTWMLMGTGLLGLIYWTRRQREMAHQQELV